MQRGQKVDSGRRKCPKTAPAALSNIYTVITKQMLLTMAIVVGVELKSKEVQEQYEELKACLVTLDRYEIQR